MKTKILNPLHKKVADRYMEIGNATQAIIDVGATTSTSRKVAGAKANQIISREEVKKYIESRAYAAAMRIEDLAESSENHQVKLAANKDILDRAGYKPQETNVNITVPMYLPPEVMEKYELDGAKKYAAIPEEEEVKEINYFTNNETNTSPEGNN